MDVSLGLVQLAKTTNFQNLSDIMTSPAAMKVFGIDVSLQVCVGREDPKWMILAILRLIPSHIELVM